MLESACFRKLRWSKPIGNLTTPFELSSGWTDTVINGLTIENVSDEIINM